MRDTHQHTHTQPAATMDDFDRSICAGNGNIQWMNVWVYVCAFSSTLHATYQICTSSNGRPIYLLPSVVFELLLNLCMCVWLSVTGFRICYMNLSISIEVLLHQQTFGILFPNECSTTWYSLFYWSPSPKKHLLTTTQLHTHPHTPTHTNLCYIS